jgi:tRNA dimethylallyltransferase
VLLALVGPTASGKTEASLVLAERLGAEILSVDAMVVYRGMDAGTAKPTAEQRERVPHHLLDLADPTEPFSVATYQAAAREAVADIERRGRRPLLVGGSGLYFRAVVDDLVFPGTDPSVRSALEAEAEAVAIGPGGLYHRLKESDPAAASRIEPANVRRTVRALEVAAVTGRAFSSFAAAWDRYPPERVRAAGIDIPREVLHRRIDERVTAMWPDLLRESAALPTEAAVTSSQAIGYTEAAAIRAGTLTTDEALQLVTRRTRNLARRQMAWFRRDPRIRWFAAEEGGASEVVDEVLRYLEGNA